MTPSRLCAAAMGTLETSRGFLHMATGLMLHLTTQGPPSRRGRKTIQLWCFHARSESTSKSLPRERKGCLWCRDHHHRPRRIISLQLKLCGSSRPSQRTNEDPDPKRASPEPRCAPAPHPRDTAGGHPRLRHRKRRRLSGREASAAAGRAVVGAKTGKAERPSEPRGGSRASAAATACWGSSGLGILSPCLRRDHGASAGTRAAPCGRSTHLLGWPGRYATGCHRRPLFAERLLRMLFKGAAVTPAHWLRPASAAAEPGGCQCACRARPAPDRAPDPAPRARHASGPAPLQAPPRLRPGPAPAACPPSLLSALLWGWQLAGGRRADTGRQPGERN